MRPNTLTRREGNTKVIFMLKRLGKIHVGSELSEKSNPDPKKSGSTTLLHSIENLSASKYKCHSLKA